MRYVAAGVFRGWNPAVIGGAALALTVSMAAHADMVGPAAGYGVFVFGNGNFSSQNTDSARNIAVGGNVQLENYAVASAIAGNPAQTPNPARLVVGGNLTATNGGVGQGQNGALYVGGTTSLTGFTATGGQFGQTLVDFGAAQTLYQGLTASYGALAANGTTNLGGGNTLSLTGSNSILNVFNVTSAQLTASQSMNIAAPGGSTVLINVTGDNAVFQNGQVSFAGGVGAAHVLYNFVTATSVTLAGGKDPMGSILAPYAGVRGNYGAMSGQLITGSYGGAGSDPYGHTEFHAVTFAGQIAVVPLPAALPLLLSGCVALGGLVARRRRIL